MERNIVFGDSYSSGHVSMGLLRTSLYYKVKHDLTSIDAEVREYRGIREMIAIVVVEALERGVFDEKD